MNMPVTPEKSVTDLVAASDPIVIDPKTMAKVAPDHAVSPPANSKEPAPGKRSRRERILDFFKISAEPVDRSIELDKKLEQLDLHDKYELGLDSKEVTRHCRLRKLQYESALENEDLAPAERERVQSQLSKLLETIDILG